MPVMTAEKLAALQAKNLQNCLCCGKRVKVGAKYILVSPSVGIQHEEPCPRSIR